MWKERQNKGMGYSVKVNETFKNKYEHIVEGHRDTVKASNL